MDERKKSFQKDKKMKIIKIKKLRKKTKTQKVEKIKNKKINLKERKNEIQKRNYVVSFHWGRAVTCVGEMPW